ncbi:uncharacterized protein LOC125541018 [Triticum urartu]|uniref:Uncharacterized protein n=1 Tax=Triticum urartu TaxID=4572 RepID=A0A8R7TDT3_TRIUA|nr:uncharacterized protein LOC125541018 [Triticum urartu]
MITGELSMAALLPCARVALAPSVSVAGSIGSSSLRWTLPVPSLRRRGSPTLKHVVRASKGAADQPDPPADPEGDGGDEEENPKMVNAEEIYAELEKFKEEYAAKKGLPYEKRDMTDEMFYNEKWKIYKYIREMISSNPSILHVETALSQELCIQAGDALDLAKNIVYSASYRLKRPSEISVNTTEQMVRIYASTFMKTAEDVYHGKTNTATLCYYLDALGGLAAISHILFVDTLDAVNDVLLEDGKPKHSPDVDAEAAYRRFEQKLSLPERKVWARGLLFKPCEILEQIVCPATKHTRQFIAQMIRLRKDALNQVPDEHKIRSDRL